MERPLKEFLTEADEATGKASEIARNLGLGAIAVIWIFKNPEKSPVYLPNRVLSWALFLAVTSLGTDLFQYIFRSVTLHYFFWNTEKKYDAKKLTEEDIKDIHSPNFIIWGSWAFWIIKILSIFIAYVLIGYFLAGKLS